MYYNIFIIYNTIMDPQTRYYNKSLKKNPIDSDF